MLKDNILIAEYIKRITVALTDAGLSKEETAAFLVQLDEQIMRTIAEDLEENLVDGKREEFDSLMQKNPTSLEIAQFLGVSEAEVVEKVLHLLEEYLFNLQKNSFA